MRKASDATATTLPHSGKLVSTKNSSNGLMRDSRFANDTDTATSPLQDLDKIKTLELFFTVLFQGALIAAKFGVLYLFSTISYGGHNVSDLTLLAQARNDWQHVWFSDVEVPVNTTSCGRRWSNGNDDFTSYPLFNYTWPGLQKSCDCTPQSEVNSSQTLEEILQNLNFDDVKEGACGYQNEN